MTKHEAPRWRVVVAKGKDMAYIANKLYRDGIVIGYSGWPVPELEPVNEAAQRIAAYHATRRNSPTFPHSPYDRIVRDIFLPAVLAPSAPETRHAEAGSRLLSPVTEGVTEDMPRYKARYGMTVGKFHVDQGMDFHFLGWPEEGMDPENAAAKQVSAYLEANKDNPKLLPAPWCLYQQALVLPELPGLPASLGPREPSEQIDPFPELVHDAKARKARTRPPRQPNNWADFTE